MNIKKISTLLSTLILMLLNILLNVACTKADVAQNSTKGIKGLNDIDWREYYFPYAKADYELLNRNDPNDKISISVEAVSISPLRIKYTKEFSNTALKSSETTASTILYEINGQTVSVVSHLINNNETISTPVLFNSITQSGKIFGSMVDKKILSFFPSTTLIHSDKTAKIMKISEIKKTVSVKVSTPEGEEFYAKGIGLVSARVHNIEYVINRESLFLKCLKDKTKSSATIDASTCTNTLSRDLPDGIRLN